MHIFCCLTLQDFGFFNKCTYPISLLTLGQGIGDAPDDLFPFAGLYGVGGDRLPALWQLVDNGAIQVGIGAEPASCATVAGLRKLVDNGTIDPDSSVCGILTGHLLKDPDVVVGYHTGDLDGIEARYANAPISVPDDLDAILAELRRI